MRIPASIAATLLVAGLYALPAAAQDYANEAGEQLREERQQRAEDDQIIVTGRAQDASAAEIHRQARDIAVSGNVYDVPLARFEDPLCPGIAGLTAESAGIMIERIRANARFVDMRVQDDDCEANFVVAFVDDGQAMLRRMMDDSPARFQYLTSVEKREMLEPGPVRVWTDVQPTSRDGMRIGRGRNLVNPPNMRAEMAHSKIYTTIRNDIVMVWVIIDREAARGMSLQQLADYATMRGLVRTEPEEDMRISSILGLFNRNGPWPEELTDFDRAYLTAVYDSIPNLPAFRKIGRVATELRYIEDARDEAETGETAE